MVLAQIIFSLSKHRYVSTSVEGKPLRNTPVSFMHAIDNTFVLDYLYEASIKCIWVKRHAVGKTHVGCRSFELTTISAKSACIPNSSNTKGSSILVIKMEQTCMHSHN